MRLLLFAGKQGERIAREGGAGPAVLLAAGVPASSAVSTCVAFASQQLREPFLHRLRAFPSDGDAVFSGEAGRFKLAFALALPLATLMNGGGGRLHFLSRFLFYMSAVVHR